MSEYWFSVFPAILLSFACTAGGAPAESPGPSSQVGARGQPASTTVGTPPQGWERPVVEVGSAPGDPNHGNFTLAAATAGLKGDGAALLASFRTSMGDIDCELWPRRAPRTVANFVGLARGVRPWKDGARWVKRPFFDDTEFHRVVPGFVIQAGGPKGRKSDGPGYRIPDEIWKGSKHDRAGLLCMANDGPDTGGSQFFIMAGADGEQLDGSYTIFGECFQTDVVENISKVRTFAEEPAERVTLKRVHIHRGEAW